MTINEEHELRTAIRDLRVEVKRLAAVVAWVVAQQGVVPGPRPTPQDYGLEPLDVGCQHTCVGRGGDGGWRCSYCGARVPEPAGWTEPPALPTTRSCNKHIDCDLADQLYREANPGRVLGAFHCHDECCEDCFGQ